MSIGSDFMIRFAMEAQRHDLPCRSYAAKLAKDLAMAADTADCRRAEEDARRLSAGAIVPSFILTEGSQNDSVSRVEARSQ